MTALQALINQLTEQSKQDFSDKTLDEKLKMLEQEFSVRLRNTDSSTDNASVEQLHSDEELISKIEDMALNLAETSLCQKIFSAKVKQTFAFEYFQQQLKDLFKTHRNTVSTASKYSIDVNADAMRLPGKTVVLERAEEVVELESEIMQELVAFGNWGYNDKLEFESEELDQAVESIAKLFKTYQNSVLRQDLNQVSKYSNRGETESKIAFKNSLRHHVGKLVTADQELDQIVENIANFFIDTVNPVFRALNDSDEQSIVK